MINTRTRLAALAAAACTLVTSSCVTLPAPRALEPDPVLRQGQLANGFRYAVRANPTPAGHASLRLVVAVGSLHENDDERGVAHFLEHLAFNGSTHFPAGTLVEHFQRLGMQPGSDANASTSLDRTIYTLELPDTRPDTLADALTLFRDVADGLLLTPAAVEKERGIILSEKRARDSAAMRAQVDALKFKLPQTRLAERMPIGTAEVIAGVPRERIAAFYDAWYRPERLFVVAVGDFDPAAVESQIAGTFATLSARAPARPTDPGRVLPASEPAARLFVDTQAAAVTLSIDALAPYVRAADTAEQRIGNIPRELAVAMVNRRLALLAQREDAPFTRARSSVTEQLAFFRQSSIEASAEPGRWQHALSAMEQELHRTLDHGFRREEMREAIDSWRSRVEQDTAAAGTWPSSRFAARLVESVLEDKVSTSPAADLLLFEQGLARVTLDDCIAAWREAWSPSGSRHIHISGNLQLAAPEQEILAAYRASQAVALSAGTWKPEEVFAYTDFGPPGQVTSSRSVDDLDATLLQFANGVRLNLKRTDFEAGAIHVSLRIGSGMLTLPRDQPGLTQLAEFLIAAGGLGRHSAFEIGRLLDGRKVRVSFSVRGDALLLSGLTRREDLLLQLQILCALAVDPGYRPEALRQHAEGTERLYISLAHDVTGPLRTEVPRILALGDSRFGLPEKSVALGRTVQEVRAWLDPQFARGPVEIALVGDLDPQAAVAAVASTFGALPQREAKPDYTAERKVFFPAPPLSRSYAVSTAIDRGIVQVRWAATDALDAARTHQLHVLSDILQDRLRLRLREEQGDTYSPSARTELSDIYPGYGFIVADASVAPDRAESVLQSIKAVAAGMAERGVTQDELQRATKPILAKLREAARRNGYWVGTVLASAQEHPQKLEAARAREAHYAAITIEQVNALAAEFLEPARTFAFVSLPQP